MVHKIMREINKLTYARDILLYIISVELKIRGKQSHTILNPVLMLI